MHCDGALRWPIPSLSLSPSHYPRLSQLPSSHHACQSRRQAQGCRQEGTQGQGSEEGQGSPQAQEGGRQAQEGGQGQEGISQPERKGSDIFPPVFFNTTPLCGGSLVIPVNATPPHHHLQPTQSIWLYWLALGRMILPAKRGNQAPRK